MQKVAILDTSVMCCWLQIPGKETAGSGHQKWDYKRIDDLLKERIREGYFLVLPMATVIETGNHISQANSLRFEVATELGKILSQASRGDSPWATFTDQAFLFAND